MREEEKIKAQKQFRIILIDYYLWIASLTLIAPIIALVIYLFRIYLYYFFPFSLIIGLTLLIVFIRFATIQFISIKTLLKSGILKDPNYRKTLQRPTKIFIIIEILFLALSTTLFLGFNPG